jgi:ATP-dependent DNA helicase RecG
MMFGVNDQRRIEGLDDPEQVEDLLIDICRNRIKPALLPRLDKVYFDNGARIVILQVDDRRAPHSTPENRYFVRVGSTKREAEGDEIAALFSRSRTAAFEDLPVIRATMLDVDEALVWSYIRDIEGENFRETAGFPTAEAMHDLRLTVAMDGQAALTLAGLLLFGRSESVETLIPQSRLLLTRYSGNTATSPIVEQSELYGNLGSLFDRALAFIKRYADLWTTRPHKNGGSSEQPISARANYSSDVVNEALSNLLLHRDYAMSNSPSRIQVYDDRIEFINAAHSYGRTRKSIEYGATLRQNPRLHSIFTRSEYGSAVLRRGIPALRRAQTAFAKREPRLAILNDEFRLEIHGV